MSNSNGRTIFDGSRRVDLLNESGQLSRGLLQVPEGLSHHFADLVILLEMVDILAEHQLHTLS